jgi:hypothetical protein
MARTQYKNSKILHKEITFSISEKGMRVKAYALDFKSSWRNLSRWRQKDGWLVLIPHGMQALYFPVEKLQEAGVYEAVMAILSENKHEDDI